MENYIVTKLTMVFMIGLASITHLSACSIPPNPCIMCISYFIKPLFCALRLPFSVKMIIIKVTYKFRT